MKPLFIILLLAIGGSVLGQDTAYYYAESYQEWDKTNEGYKTIRPENTPYFKFYSEPDIDSMFVVCIINNKVMINENAFLLTYNEYENGTQYGLITKKIGPCVLFVFKDNLTARFYFEHYVRKEKEQFNTIMDLSLQK